MHFGSAGFGFHRDHRGDVVHLGVEEGVVREWREQPMKRTAN